MTLDVCGGAGLCPGLNDVVQGIVRKLEDYGVPDGNILGIRSVPPPSLPGICHAKKVKSAMHRAQTRGLWGARR